VPTARPRLTITETDDVKRLLDEAAELWPEDGANRARLLKRLAVRGAEAARADAAQRQRDWTTIVQAAAGAAGPSAYPEGYLDELRGDWPA